MDADRYTPPAGFDATYWREFVLELETIAEEVELSAPGALLAAAGEIAFAATEPLVYALVQRIRNGTLAELAPSERDPEQEARVAELAERHASFHRERRAAMSWVPILTDARTEQRLRLRGRFTIHPERRTVLTASGAPVEGGWSIMQRYFRRGRR